MTNCKDVIGQPQPGIYKIAERFYTGQYCWPDFNIRVTLAKGHSDIYYLALVYFLT